jgi:XTP/dITP diphosphohydrolase
LRVYVATKNEGKLRELRAIFAGSGWDLMQHDGYREVLEDGATYAANAALKARALHAQLAAQEITEAVIGDDSGLEVAALDGRPGVLSARYFGPNASWPERRKGILAELRDAGASDRRACFVCALHFIDGSGREVAVERDVQGRISEGERGSAGFSYDPIFEYPPAGRTFGELTEAEKNAVSHRARAARALLDTVDETPFPSNGGP